MKEFKRKIFTSLTQSLADVLIIKLQNATTKDEFYMWFEIAAKLDAYCVEFHNIYLD